MNIMGHKSNDLMSLMWQFLLLHTWQQLDFNSIIKVGGQTSENLLRMMTHALMQETKALR